MLDIEKYQSYSSHLLSSGEPDHHLQTKLGLYQVFLRIYEQNKDLLNEILDLEHSGHQAVSPLNSSYLQGVVVAGAVYVVTNLMGGKTQAVPHPEAQWTIGRDRHKANLVLAEPRLSRCHACIAYDFEQQCFYLSDLGSTNGTFINGEQIFNRYYLKDGDRIRLGNLGFTFFTYQIMPQSNSSGQNVSLSSRAPEHEVVGEDGLVASEKSTYPSGQPPAHQNERRSNDTHIPEDTMVVPTSLRPPPPQ